MNKKNIFQFGVFVFIIVILLVGFFSLFKYINQKPNYFYAKVLVKKADKDNSYPDINYTKLIKKGEKIKNFMGETEIEVLSMRYYPKSNNNDEVSSPYRIYLTLKIKKDTSKKEHFYYEGTKYKLGKLIDLDFDKAKVVGEILDIDTQPIKEKYIDKIITLWRYEGQSASNPNTFANIHIGESYFDGEEKVFEVLDKELVEPQVTNSNWQYFSEKGDLKHILVRARIKLREENGILLFAENNQIKYRLGLNIYSDHNYFDWYQVVGIE